MSVLSRLQSRVPNAAIIGAGPAGSAAALLFARKGWNVTLIEQHRFPRDKVCGECLSSLGIDVMDRLGLLPKLLACGAVHLGNSTIHSPDGRCITIFLPRPMLGISRHRLDAILLNAARDAGVAVRQPARCERIESTDADVSVRIRCLQTNALSSVNADFAIVADGKSALGGSVPRPTGDIGIKTHWINVDGPRDAIELFSCRGCYGGLAAIEDGRWNAAFSVPAKRVKAHRGNIGSLFAELIGENHSLARRLATARQVIPWLAAPLPRFAVRKNWPPRVIPIGNAAAALEPIGGEGMGLALRSAEVAVAALDNAAVAWTEVEQRRLRHAYAELWNTRRFSCRALAMAVSSQGIGDVVMDFMENNEWMGGVAMKMMGKA